jgi:glycosyltransferase involved in cell wall biosynthesis
LARVLFVHPGRDVSSFIAQDRDLLARHFDVTPLAWTRAADALAIRRALRTHDAVFTWFLGHHAAACAVAARVAGVPSIAVLGGIEPTPPELTGGPPPRFRDRWALGHAFNQSSLVLAVSRFSLDEAMHLRRAAARSALRVLHNGVDTRRFHPSGEKEELVLSVSIVEPETVHRKRLDVFLAAAAHVPEARVVLAGPLRDRAAARQLLADAPGNAELPGELPFEELRALYQRAKVYVQASRHESFGMANAEAMACACVPVVARAGALPEVVGDAGVVVPEPLDAQRLGEGIRRGLASGLGAKARARIAERFDLRRREEGLVRAVEDALAGRLQRGMLPPEPGAFQP